MRVLGVPKRQSWDLNAGGSLTPRVPTALGPSQTRLPLPVLPAARSPSAGAAGTASAPRATAPRNEGGRSHAVCAVPSGVKVPFKHTRKLKKRAMIQAS